MSVVGFGVKNLRCLTDTGVVPIKPITLLVGRNSSGKSTFLRAFPLLRQSVERGRQSPIVWYDPQYVDFGSFHDAVNFGAKEKSITFRFRIPLKGYAFVDGESIYDISMTIAEGHEGPYVGAYEILVGNHKVVMEFAPDRKLVRYEVDSQSVLMTDVSLVLGGSAVLIPTLRLLEDGRIAYIPATRQDPWFDLAESTFLHDVAERTEHYAWIENSSTRHIANLVPKVLSGLDHSIAAFASGVAYLAPLRASALRAYRIQELSVDEVDPEGRNLPMFLRSLSPQETEQLASFTRTYLDFEIQVRTDRHHAEILIKEQGADRFVNLVDVGFGYAEILPLVVTLWASCVRETEPTARPTSMVAIEQPELHLHPAHQARLARMIVGTLKAARDAGRQVSLMIETHSEALVNGLGDFIEDKTLSPDEVQIVLFEQDEETRQTKIRFASYDEDGALRNWPFGFFAPVTKNAFAIASE